MIPGIVLLILLAGATGFARPAAAQGFGDLVVSPTRIELEGRTRSATVTLTNRGSESALFRISLIAMEMDGKGSLKAVDKPPAGMLTAEELVRYAPRQVDIPPGGTQTVRLVLRKPADLAAGEYRSHMFFRAVPPEDAGRGIAEKGGQGGVSVKLTPIFGITIPVIVRHGDLDLKVAMSDLAVVPDKDKQKKLTFKLTRQGNKSAYGDVKVEYMPAGGGTPVVVGEVTRLAVFTPNTERSVEVPLVAPPGITLGKGALKVLYRQVNGDTTLASGDVTLE
ncbi:MAG: molecular chaperone [Rhodospirillales bacterium CG15_BIG_FIL_POST_REV_8_21_14_020_66_15]|nr:MAG: molecular chaperone [Rhodospirillales bacterium CG15_BIG_FIL_POST_REV_8_21_14_020_66_15]